MKKTILSLIAALVAFAAYAGTVTKSFDNLNPFSGIRISDSFKATLVQDDDFKVSVTIDSDLVEYLDIAVIGDILYVRLKDRDLKSAIRNITRRKMEVTINCPALNQIHLTGSASLTSGVKWVSPMNKFTLEASGASKAEKLRIEGSQLRAIISDASNASISGDFVDINAEVSGAAVLYLVGEYGDIKAKLGDAAKMSVMGSADSVESICEDSSFLDALELVTSEAKIDCSGASKANVNVKDKLDVDLKGASSCRYRSDNESLNVMPSVSRASSLKRLH